MCPKGKIKLVEKQNEDDVEDSRKANIETFVLRANGCTLRPDLIFFRLSLFSLLYLSSQMLFDPL